MSEDLIKRSDAAEVVYKALKTPPPKGVLTDTMSLAIALVRDIPSADRPQGEWVHLKGDEWLCSNCGYVVWTEGSWEHPLERGKDYCEHCGARMRPKLQGKHFDSIIIDECAMKGADDEDS